MKHSYVEEIICVLWLIAAFAAMGAGAPKWVFIALFIKAVLDFTDSIKALLREVRDEKRRAK